MVWRLVLSLLFLALAASQQELEKHWRKSTLADSGRTYWWRPSEDGTSEPEISFSVPSEAWRKGHLDDGAPFLWRTDPSGEPDVKLWRKSWLDSGEPFWYTADGPQEVLLTDPFEHAATHDEL